MSDKMATTRTILQALTALCDGFDAGVIAHPAAVAFEIADEVASIATRLAIPHELRESGDMERSDDSVPLVFIRPHGWEALPVRRGAPGVRIFAIDASARGDRTLSPPTRYVVPLER